jgi:hypothetical protein
MAVTADSAYDHARGVSCYDVPGELLLCDAEGNSVLSVLTPSL